MLEAVEYQRHGTTEIISEQLGDWLRCNFEDGTFPFELSGATCGAPEVDLSTAAGYTRSKGNSMRVGAGAAGGHTTPGTGGGLGAGDRFRAEFRFRGDGANLVDADLNYLQFDFDTYDGATRKVFRITIDGATTTITYLNAALGQTDTGLTWPTFTGGLWRYLSFDIDFANGILERVRIDEESAEIQAAIYTVADPVTLPNWYLSMPLDVANTGDMNRVYFDEINITRLPS
jgi:hypothetical protein